MTPAAVVAEALLAAGDTRSHDPPVMVVGVAENCSAVAVVPPTWKVCDGAAGLPCCISKVTPVCDTVRLGPEAVIAMTAGMVNFSLAPPDAAISTVPLYTPGSSPVGLAVIESAVEEKAATDAPLLEESQPRG